jgi:hypothetical protein
MDVMSSILLSQHKEMLQETENITTMYWWLIHHPPVSYCLYFAGTLIELSFLTGFFTKRYDKVLASLYILFLIMNLIIMRINYWQTFPFIIVLIYSNMLLIDPKSSHKRKLFTA